jgi:predicted nuclease with TOPRIM domain|tara:strand:- start:182 stop:499 length:318 start_codon:yes stop_codon:yes gene_type:complete
MAEQIKFTNEELESINKLRQDVANVFTRLGQLTLEKKRRISEVEQAENELTVKHSNLVSEEQELFKSLNEKYGDGNYDPVTNTFTPIKSDDTVEENTEISKEVDK